MKAIQLEVPLNLLLPLAASGLASAWMLLWAGAAAIPIAIHFLNKRNPKRAPWAAMRLLLAVVEQESKRVRVEQLLLLILRVLIPLVLAFALARPYWNALFDGMADPQTHAPQLWIVGIDVSYSMGYKQDQQTRLFEAKQQAAELIRNSSIGDAYSLVALSDDSRGVISQPSFDKDAMLVEIGQLELTDTGLDLSSGLSLIDDLASDAATIEGIPADVQIVLYSDLGTDAWYGSDDVNTQTSQAESRLQRLHEKYACKVVSLATDNTSNVAITAMQASANRTLVGKQLDIDIDVENFSGSPRDDLLVQLSIDDRTIASRSVDVGANSSRTVRFKTKLNGIGPAVLTANIPEDRLPADDSRSIIVQVTEQFRVLVVEEFREQARPIALALRPDGTDSSSGLKTISRIDLSATPTSDWDAIVLYNIPSIQRSTYSRLLKFAQDGGAVILMHGSSTNAVSWNSLESSSSGSLAGLQLLEPSPEDLWEIDALQYASPVVAPFQGFPDSGLLTTPIFRFWTIVSDEQLGKNLLVDLATTSGEPLIVRHRVGAGWVASMLSAPQSGLEASDSSQPTWNAIATWPSFVPLAQQLLQATLDNQDEQSNLFAGRPVEGVIRQALESATVTIQRPDATKDEILTNPIRPDGSLLWRYTSTQTRGIYTATLPGGRSTPYAVNVNPRESSLESLSPTLLPNSTLVASRNKSMQQESSPVSHDHLARWALGALAALLVFESLLARFIGRRTQ